MIRALFCRLGFHRKPRKAAGVGYWCLHCGKVVWLREGVRR